MNTITLGMGLAGLAAIFTLPSISMAETPTPEAAILREDGKFAIKQYGTLTLVRAPMKNSGDDGSFGKLFAYITGKNSKSRKIPMTAPVLIDRSGGGGGMSFIMPPDLAPQTAPEPTDATLEKLTLPAGRFAVYRYSGGRNPGNEAKAIAALENWMAGQKLVAADKPLFGYYDPPWIPTWFRRNEVWIRLAGD